MVLLPLPLMAEELAEEVVLDAEKVVFDQSSQIGKAEGNVRLTWGSFSVFAPEMEVNVSSKTVRAEGSQEHKVILLEGDRQLTGTSLNYDLNTREGTLHNVSTVYTLEEGRVYLKGENVALAPKKVARERKWYSIEEDASDDEFAAKWENVSITTCSEPSPHYHLVTRRIIILPGGKVIAQKPEVYLGSSKIFTYPFDYIFDDKEHSSFLPTLHYESEKGVGVGIRPSWSLGPNTSLDSRIVGWSDSELEWRAGLSYRFSDSWSFFADSAYEYDLNGENIDYRPEWGLEYNRDGWSGHLRWSEREVFERELKTGGTYRTSLWRDPEISLVSPWWIDPASVNTMWRLFASWGRYEEAGITAERTSYGIDLKGHYPIHSGQKILWRIDHTFMDYDTGQSQEITNANLGLKWPLGRVTCVSSYRRTWVSGSSAMVWDEREEIEKLYQSFLVPLSDSTTFGLRGAYNLETSDFDERIYQLFLDRDCMQWVLSYRDDLAEDDDWASLKLVVKAFPDTDLAVGNRVISEWYDPEE